MLERRRSPGRPAETGDGLDPGQHPAARSPVDVHADTGIGPGADAGVQIPLHLLHHRVGREAGVGVQPEVGGARVVRELSPVHERAVAQVLAPDAPEERPHLRGVQGVVAKESRPHLQHLGAFERLVFVAGEHELDQATAAAGRGVDDHRAGVGHRRAQLGQRPLTQSIGDPVGADEALAHRGRHLVDRAARDRVVGRVARQLEPRLVQQRTGPARRRKEQRAERLCQPLQCPLGARRRLLEVDPCRCHAPEEVGPLARPQLARPVWQLVGGRSGHLGGERRDDELVLVLGLVGRGHQRAQPGLGAGAVRPVHQEDPVDGDLAELGLVGGQPPGEGGGVVGQGRAVAVAAGEVLGPHRGTVRGRPPEARSIDRRGHAPPHDRVADPGRPQELRHLGDMAEVVRQVADGHGTTEAGGPVEPQPQVAHDRLARDGTYQGPISSRPEATRRRIRSSAPGLSSR